MVEGFEGVARVPGVQVVRADAKLGSEGLREGFGLPTLAGVEEEERVVVVSVLLWAAVPQPKEPGEGLRGDEKVGEGWVLAGVSVGGGSFFWRAGKTDPFQKSS